MSFIDSFLNSLIRIITKKRKRRKKKVKSRRAARIPSRSSSKKKSKPSASKRKIFVNKKKKSKNPSSKVRPRLTGKRRTGTGVIKIRREKTSVGSPKKANDHSAKNKNTIKNPLLSKPKRRPKSPKLESGGQGAVSRESESKEQVIGQITHYFSRIQVAVLKMTGGKLNVGERIRIKGRGTDFIQKVASLQIESVDVKTAQKGQLVGLKIIKLARPGDKVFKI